MHANAVNKIRNKVEGSLKNCLVVDNWPEFDSFSVHVESLGREVLKHKQEWLSLYDCYSIFYNLVYEAIMKKVKGEEKLKGSLWDLLGDSNAEKLKETLIEFFLSIPRDYDIYLPIPKVSIDLEEIALSEKLSITSFDDKESISKGWAGLASFANRRVPAKHYLRYSISGYINSNLENRTLKKALSNFKIVLQQGISKKLFKITEGPIESLGMFIEGTHYQIPKIKTISVDKTSNSDRLIETELPLGTSKFLSSIDIDTSNMKVSNAIEDGLLMTLIKAFLRLPSLLIENLENEALRVKSGIEWCFDSYSTDDLTMSFLMTCFGLESLLGEDSPSESITKTLSDRCAYLIGSGIKGRKTIRDEFIKLYKTRSSLVHGHEKSLGEDQKNLLNWGRLTLEYSIFKEIKHLNMDKTT